MKEKKMKYTYDKITREISGFGGDYEESCRKMVITGMEWLDENKGANPTFDQFKHIFGITTNENEDMKALQKQMAEAVSDCTGAMMQATTNHVLFAWKNGWEKYTEEMQEEVPDEDN